VVPLGELFSGPGSTVLAPGELITAIEIPVPKDPMGDAFARVTRRRGVDLASVNLGCVVEQSGAVRFGLGAVGPTPLFTETTVDDLADEGWDRVLSVASPISDVRAGADYRRAMLAIHARRALERAMSRLAGGV
jgi:carbon-monoxide dehydrogenase medium subunit